MKKFTFWALAMLILSIVNINAQVTITFSEATIPFTYTQWIRVFPNGTTLTNPFIYLEDNSSGKPHNTWAYCQDHRTDFNRTWNAGGNYWQFDITPSLNANSYADFFGLTALERLAVTGIKFYVGSDEYINSAFAPSNVWPNRLSGAGSDNVVVNGEYLLVTPITNPPILTPAANGNLNVAKPFTVQYATKNAAITNVQFRGIYNWRWDTYTNNDRNFTLTSSDNGIYFWEFPVPNFATLAGVTAASLISTIGNGYPNRELGVRVVENATNRNITSLRFDITYIQDVPVLSTPTNLSITPEGVLTFTGDPHAVSHTVYVYLNGAEVFNKANFVSGNTINYTVSGEYTVKVKSFGDLVNYNNSDFSAPVNWTRFVELPPVGISEYCYAYWDPAPSEGGEAKAGNEDAVVWTWETQTNGNITVTLDPVNNNNPRFRAAFSAGNFRVGQNTVSNGATYFNTSFSGNVMTISLKSGITLSEGADIYYVGNVPFATDGAACNNLYPTPATNIHYTYGSNCSDLVRDPLDKPINVAIDNNRNITFDPVQYAGNYTVYIYDGANLLYSQVLSSNSEVLGFTFYGNFNVYVKALPAPQYMQLLSESPLSDVYAWSRPYTPPTTIPQSVYCNYEYSDGTAARNTLWTWETNTSNQLVITIARSDLVNQVSANFRPNGMNPALFTIDGVNASNYLEKVGDNTGTTQTFQGKNGFTLLPGMLIKYSGMIEYQVVIAPNTTNNIYPTVTFATPYIIGSNCSGPVTILPAPVNLNITNKVLTFDPVTNASSYKVYMYDSGNNPVYTIDNFVSGSMINYNFGGTYTVKVQAIGDGISYLSSELSAGITFVIDPCNLLSTHPLILGNSSITYINLTPDANYGTVKSTAPYFAPNNNPSTNYTATATATGATITLGVATQAQWQAQFRLLPTTPIYLKAGEKYDIQMKVTTNKSTPVYCKIFDQNDNVFIEMAPRQNVTGEKVFTLLNTSIPTGMDRIFQLLFDFGQNAANTNIVISDIIICGAEMIKLATPVNLSITNNALTFDAVPNASSYTVFVYNSSNTVVYTKTNFVSGSTINYTAPGHNTVKVQAIGDDITYVSSDLSAAKNWDIYGTLPAPTNLSINSANELTFDAVAGATSYTVYVYNSSNTVVHTIPNFVIGSVINYSVLGHYTVKAKAIGDGDVILDSELSAAINWDITKTLTAPTNLSISSDNKLTFDPVTDATSYKVYIYNTSGVLVNTITNFVIGSVINYNVVGSYTVKAQAIGNGDLILDSELSAAVNWHLIKVLTPPTNISVNAQNELNFDAVNNASSYTVYIYNTSGVLVNTITNFVPGSVINYTVVGHYTIKVQTIGDGIDYISSELSNPINWNFTKILATPSNLNIDVIHNLTFDAVQNTSSYTVFVYQNAGDATALVTLPNFTIGSVVNMGALPYGTYYVKVKAIGDNDLYFDSEFSTAYMWNYQELPCNVVYYHPFTAGGVFYAPNWTESTNYTFSASGISANIHLGDATTEVWQAQFRIVFKTPIDFNASTRYEVKFNVKTVGEANMYAKMFESNDVIFVELLQRAAINAPTGVEKTMRFTPNTNPTGTITRVSQVLLDFGGSAANLDIEITNFSICEAEMIKLNTPANLSVSGNILTFDAVEHASSYTVYIYDASNVLAKTITNFVSGSAITNLQSGNYTIKVQAIGDNIDYLDSELSAAYTYVHTGLGDVTENTISIFPNPVENILNISGTTAKEAYIIDVLGKKQSVSIIDNTINVYALTKGIYLLVIDNQTIRFIKK